MVTNLRRWMIAIVAAFTLLAMPGVGTQSAAAASLGITNMHCEPTTSGSWLCDVYTSGGAGGNTFTWVGVKNAYVTGQNNAATHSTAYGNCTIGTRAYVKVTVKDRNGASVTQTRSFSCQGMPF